MHLAELAETDLYTLLYVSVVNRHVEQLLFIEQEL